MKYLLLTAIYVGAMPALRMFKRQAPPPTDTQILQLAASLENLEDFLYRQALEKFDDAAFASEGYPSWVRGRIEQIGEHEHAHAVDLNAVLGADKVDPCTYSFPYTTVSEFLALAAVVEDVGTAAYAGAAKFITNPAYLTVAALIMLVEGRHQAWMGAAVQKGPGWSSPYDTAITPNTAFTIASAFITSCPETNPKLPFRVYPSLVADAPAAGAQGTFTFDNSNTTKEAFAYFFNGLGRGQATLTQSGDSFTATVPAGLQGYTFVIISTATAEEEVAAVNVVAGPAILFYTFDSSASNPAFRGVNATS